MIKRILMATSFMVLLIWACNNLGVNYQDPIAPQATFSSIQKNVFSRSCAVSGCHDGSQRPNLRSGSAYKSIIDVSSSTGVKYINPGSPGSSYLYLKLIANNIGGQRMPLNQSRLSTAITDSISLWITEGADNN